MQSVWDGSGQEVTSLTHRDMGPGPLVDLPAPGSYQGVFVSVKELPLCSQAGEGAGKLSPSLQALQEVSFKSQPQGRINSHYFSAFVEDISIITA